MKSIAFIIRSIFLACLVFGCANSNLHAQDEVVELTLHARSVPKDPDAVRLLPREQELRDGNAAIELLRMPWEQSHFMNLERKRINDWLEMEGDNPELLKYESAFAVFKNKMRRAAYTRDADWDYPLGEQPLVTILLPDVQGMRSFVGRIMSLWIRVQIAKGNVQGAEEGILIQMACARHVCRTPFIVCHLVGAAIGQIGFTQFEDLIQHPDSQNYYYALSMLPDTLGNFNSTIDLEAIMVRSSIPSIAGTELPPVGDKRWKKAFEELYENYIFSMTTAPELDKKNLLRQAHVIAEDLPALTGLPRADVDKMSDEEISTRWILANSDRLIAKYIAAIQLPTHQTIQELIKLEDVARKLNSRTVPDDRTVPEGAVPTRFFNLASAQAFIGCHRFGRRAKLLQIVEAIRHYASENSNQLPQSLAEIDLVLPVDPFTNKQANYELKDGVATLRWPRIENLEEPNNYNRIYSYKLKMAKSK